MCDGQEGCCCNPDAQKEKPEECPPKQTKECHGDVEEHPCETPAEDK